jgi:hypothetical protein
MGIFHSITTFEVSAKLLRVGITRKFLLFDLEQFERLPDFLLIIGLNSFFCESFHKIISRETCVLNMCFCVGQDNIYHRLQL